MEIEIVLNDNFLEIEYLKLLSFVSSAFNYNFRDLGISKYRFIGKQNNQIVIHAALSDRVISINDNSYTALFLGQVCTKQDLRNKGYGKKIIEYIKGYNFDREYDLILLNCGESVIDFYKKQNFFMICSTAEYLRENKNEVDNDPVLCFILNKQISMNSLFTEAIFLGNDF